MHFFNRSPPCLTVTISGHRSDCHLTTHRQLIIKITAGRTERQCVESTSAPIGTGHLLAAAAAAAVVDLKWFSCSHLLNWRVNQGRLIIILNWGGRMDNMASEWPGDRSNYCNFTTEMFYFHSLLHANDYGQVHNNKKGICCMPLILLQALTLRRTQVGYQCGTSWD